MAPQKILILMSTTGAGHRSGAKALAAEFHRRHAGRFEVEIIDLLVDYLPWPSSTLPTTYSLLARYAPAMWAWVWRQSGRPQVVRVLAAAACRFTESALQRTFRRHDPDLIISVHPLFQDICLHALEAMKHRTPFVTVVTDLTNAHALWFHPHVKICFVADEVTYRHVPTRGLRHDKLRVSGLPVHPDFGDNRAPSTLLRQQLGLAPHLPAVLLMGGGDGVGRLAEIAAAVDRRLCEDGHIHGQMVVICGHNDRLRRKLDAMEWSIPTVIQGFVPNMPDWMTACDCLISKAGPGTIAEALASGLPTILYGYIPGQETGNIAFVVDRGAGVYDPDPVDIAARVRCWFEDDVWVLDRMGHQARQAAPRDAAGHIVDSVVQLLDK